MKLSASQRPATLRLSYARLGIVAAR